MENVPINVQNVQDPNRQNHDKFMKVYREIVSECVARRKAANLSQEYMAEWLNVDRRKIIEFERGLGGVGLLLNYADRFDLEVKLSFIKW